MIRRFSAPPTLSAALRALAVLATAAGLLGGTTAPVQAQQALVVCPPADAAGCERIVQALTSSTSGSPSFPGGVHRHYETLRTLPLAELGRYAVVVVPSLANEPYELLRERAVAERLRMVLRGRVAVWSGTPDRGSAAAGAAGKRALIQTLAGWAAAHHATTGATGLVAFQDFSDEAPQQFRVSPDRADVADAGDDMERGQILAADQRAMAAATGEAGAPVQVRAFRYQWLEGIAGVRVLPDVAVHTYRTVRTDPAAAAGLEPVGALTYDNMASFGLADPTPLAGGAGGLAVGRPAARGLHADGSRGQVVLVTVDRQHAPSAAVGVEGGTIVLGTAPGLQLALSPGAVGESMVLSATPVDGIEGQLLPGSMVTVSPAGYRFAAPVRLTLSYAGLTPDSDAGLTRVSSAGLTLADGVDPAHLVVRQRRDDGTWETLGAVAVDTVARTVSVSITGTGTFGLAVSPPKPVVASITLEPSAATLAVGETRALTLTATDSRGAPVSGAEVRWQSGAGSEIVGAADVTDAAGQAVAEVRAVSGTAGTTYDVTATVGDHVAAARLTVAAGAAASLAFTVPPSDAAAGQPIAPAVQVTIRDAAGNAVTTATGAVTIAIAGNPAGGTLAGTRSVAPVAGVATFTDLAIDRAGTGYTLAASYGGAPDAVSGAFAIAPGAPSASTSSLATSATTLPADGTSTATLTVQLRDAAGNALTTGGPAVVLSTTAGALSAVADHGDGSYTATLTAGTTVATATVTGTLNGAALADTATVAFTAGAPASMVKVAGDAQSAAVGTAVAVAPAVRITDAGGIPVPNVTVTFAVIRGGGSVTGATQTTDADGVATLGGWTLGTTAGTGSDSLAATAGALSTGFAATATAGAATQLAITTQPSATAASGAALVRQPVVQLQDVAGNAVSQAGVTVTVAIASGGVTLGGTTSVSTDASGVATFTDLAITGTAGDRTLSFSATGLTGATSDVIAITAGPPAVVAITAQPSATAQAGIAFAQQPVVQLRDAAGNPAFQAGVTVTAAIASGGGVLGGTVTATTDASGVATFTDLSVGGTAGARTLTFSASGLTGATSDAVTVTAGAAAALAFTVQPSNVVASAPITPAVQLSIVDAYGNLVAGATHDVTLAIGTNPSGGTLSGTTTVAATGGVATFSDLSLNLIGTGYTVAASAGSLGTATSAGFTVTHGPLDHFLVEAAGGGPIGNQLAGTPFNVRVTAQDAYNNTVTAFTGTVGFTSTPGGGLSAGATSGAFTAGVRSSHSITFGTAGSFTLTATNSAGAQSGTSNSFDVQAPPTAVNEGPAANSAPGQPFHALYSSSGSPQTFTLPAPGVLSNDNLGFPAATVTSFGADSLGGSATTYAAGSTVSPLPGTGRTTGSLSVSANGTVTFTPPDGFTGNYVFRYRLTNVRGTSDARVTIAVGERPAAVNDSYTPVLVGNVPINTATGTQFRVTANDRGDRKTLAITGQSNGTATLNADSTFTFRPTPGYSGPASFTYTVSNGFGTSAPATVSLTVGTPIWFVNSAAGAGGDGRYDAPFNSLASLAAINDGTGNNPAANDRIFLYTGTGSYTGPLTLLSGQRLLGQGATASLSSIAGVTWPADAGSEPAMNGTAPTLVASDATALTLANVGSATAANNTLRGFDIGDVGATGTALAGTSFGTLDVSEVRITTNGRALNLATGTMGGSFAALRSTGGTNNVLLTGVATGGGNRTLGTAADLLGGATGSAVIVSEGAGAFTFPMPITNASTTGRAVVVQSKTGGTVTFGGPVTATGTAGGVQLAGNTAATTVRFEGGLALSTGAGNAFEGTGAGTVVATQNNAGIVNTLATTGGVALSLNGVTIGADGLTFRSISANGGSNGIALSNTGATAGLTVTGTGTAGSGGTIQNTTGAGIALSGTISPSFDRIVVQNTGGSGIAGTGVVDFALTNSTIANSGTGGGANDSNIDFFADAAPGSENNLSGVVTITGNTLTSSRFHNVDIQNWSGTIGDLTISGNTMTNTSMTGGQGVRVIASGSAGSVARITRATIDDNQIDQVPSGVGLQVQCGNADAGGPAGECGTPGSGADVVHITNNRIWGASPAARIGAEGLLALLNGRGQANYNVSGNDVRHTTGRGMGVSSFGQGTMTATVTNNTIVANNTVAAAGLEISADSTSGMASTGTYTATVTGNTISQTDGVGIWTIARASSQTLRVKLQNNTIAAPLSGVRPGLRIDSGSAVGNTTVCVNLSGNTSAGSGGTQGIGLRKQGTNPAVNAFGIHGLAATDSPGVESYVAGLNPAGGGVLLLSATAGFGGCALP